MELRLAKKTDITEGMCFAILHDAHNYLRENPGDTCTATDIFELFTRFAKGLTIDPQFWLSFKDGKYSGFLVSRSTIDDGFSSLYISIAYIQPNFRGNGIADNSLATVEKMAKNAGYKTVRLKTLFDPKVYTRWIGKFGYKYRATEFIKEI